MAYCMQWMMKLTFLFFINDIIFLSVFLFIIIEKSYGLFL
jgi:hypothetical protein